MHKNKQLCTIREYCTSNYCTWSRYHHVWSTSAEEWTENTAPKQCWESS